LTIESEKAGDIRAFFMVVGRPSPGSAVRKHKGERGCIAITIPSVEKKEPAGAPVDLLPEDGCRPTGLPSWQMAWD